MSKHSGGNANEDLLRDLRLAVWRHKEPEGEFMVLSQIRQTLDHAGVAYDGCRLYRVQADNGECKMRVPSLDVRWVLVSTNGRTNSGCWERGNQPRPAIERRAATGNAPWLAQQMRCHVKAILETTFDQGVLAVYRQEAIACSDADVGLVQRLGRGPQRAVTTDEKTLSQLQAKEAQLRQAQKLQVMGQLTTEFAGEIDQHLEAIIGETSLLARREP